MCARWTLAGLQWDCKEREALIVKYTRTPRIERIPQIWKWLLILIIIYLILLNNIQCPFYNGPHRHLLWKIIITNMPDSFFLLSTLCPLSLSNILSWTLACTTSNNSIEDIWTICTLNKTVWCILFILRSKLSRMYKTPGNIHRDSISQLLNMYL